MSTKPLSTESESEFLARQAEEAKNAIGNVIDRLKDDLAKSADPRLWTKEYPWASVAAALVGGFVAASLTVPSKEQQALKRLERIERALHPEREACSNGTPEQPAAKDHGILGNILNTAIGTIQPIIMSAITGAITGKLAQPDKEEPKAAAESAQTDNPIPSPGTLPDPERSRRAGEG